MYTMIKNYIMKISKMGGRLIIGVPKEVTDDFSVREKVKVTKIQEVETASIECDQPVQKSEQVEQRQQQEELKKVGDEENGDGTGRTGMELTGRSIGTGIGFPEQERQED